MWPWTVTECCLIASTFVRICNDRIKTENITIALETKLWKAQISGFFFFTLMGSSGGSGCTATWPVLKYALFENCKISPMIEIFHEFVLENKNRLKRLQPLDIFLKTKNITKADLLTILLLHLEYHLCLTFTMIGKFKRGQKCWFLFINETAGLDFDVSLVASLNKSLNQSLHLVYSFADPAFKSSSNEQKHVL